MRYNPATDNARTIDDLAAETRAIISAPNQPPIPTAMPDDLFAATLCPTWLACLSIYSSMGNTSKVDEIQGLLDRDMERTMHHRPHQPLY